MVRYIHSLNDTENCNQWPINGVYDDGGKEYIPLFLHGSLPGMIFNGP
jgi:hypothetical protein